MSSPTSTPPPDDPLDDVFGAMGVESPVAPVRPVAPRRPDKRPLEGIEDSDTEHGPEVPGPSAVRTAVNLNVTAAVRRYAEQKKLRPEQKTQVESFLTEPASLREAKIFVGILHAENRLKAMEVAKGAYAVSDDLKKNIQSYAVAILLSSKLSTYKGTSPTKVLSSILKKHRFDLPPGIEHNKADFDKVTSAIQDALTQKRSRFKKLIGNSLRKDAKPTGRIVPPAQQQNIFDLTQAFTERTECTVNVLLCARVALMRKTFLRDASARFWDEVDIDLSKIRKKADGDTKKIARAFRHILSADRAHYGVDEYDIEDGTNTDFQQEVDDLVHAAVTNAATSVEAEAVIQPQAAAEANAGAQANAGAEALAT
ncbi:hypothetical protein C8J57DRAFT_1504167 [Mycena rebaudengoi]|nr:hypothetical protein C8J57DRAFT_1504167 [Mycena rebaudengoi]